MRSLDNSFTGEEKQISNFVARVTPYALAFASTIALVAALTAITFAYKYYHKSSANRTVASSTENSGYLGGQR